MQRRRVLIACISLVAIFLIVGWLLDVELPGRQEGASGGGERAASSGRGAQRGGGAGDGAVDAGLEPFPPEPQRFTLQEARDQSRALQEATGQFVAESLPRVESCLGASPGPRQPQNVLVTFKRNPAGTGDGYVAAAVRLLPTPGMGSIPSGIPGPGVAPGPGAPGPGASPLPGSMPPQSTGSAPAAHPRIDQRIAHCLQTLEGMPFGLNREVLPATSELQRVITLVLPTLPGR